MRAFFEWLGEKLADCFPWFIVDEWEWAMVVRFGTIAGVFTHKTGVRGSGFHWRMPFRDNVVVEPRTEQPLDLQVCNRVTADGKKVSISGNVTYQVVDPAALWRRVHDSEVSIAQMAAGLLARYVSEYKWKDLRGDEAKVLRALRRNLTSHLKAWGIRIVRIELTDLVETNQYNVFGSLVG